MTGLYTCIIHIYGLLIRFASLFNKKAKQWLTDRHNWKSALQHFTNNNSKPIIWIHCASVGECEQILPLIQKLQHYKSHHAFVITFFSPSGIQYFKNLNIADVILPLPLDTPLQAQFFCKTLNPKMVIFVKYEFWLNFLWTLKALHTPVILACAVFKAHHIFFKFYGGLFKSILPDFKFIFTQDHISEQALTRAFKSLNNIITVGDSRMDRVLEIKQQNFKDAIISDFCKNSPLVIIGGSTWPADNQLLLNAFKCLKNTFLTAKLILAPHECDVSHIQKAIILAKKLKLNLVLWSNAQIKEPIDTADVMILDTYGLLSKIYRYGHLAYVGGGFNGGLHNVLEPAVYNLPLTFSDPHYDRFNEAELLIKHQFATFCTNADALCVAWKFQYKQLSDHLYIERYNTLIMSQTGSAMRMYERLEPLL